MNKKFLFTFFLLMLLIVSTAAAGYIRLPYVIAGKVKVLGESPAELRIEIINVGRGTEIERSYIAPDGSAEFFSDLANADAGYAYGDTIQVKVCEDPACITEFKIGDESGKRMNIDISSSDVGDKVTITYQDREVTIVKELDKANLDLVIGEKNVQIDNLVEEIRLEREARAKAEADKKAAEEEAKKLAEEEKEDEENDGLSALEIGLIGLLAVIIGVFPWGKGFKGLIKYYLKKGKEARKAGDKALAKKYEARAHKMASTVVTNFLAGKYKKQLK